MSLLRGRFDGDVGKLMQQFSSSLQTDLKMLDEDIQGSSAHARMLGETGIISNDEATELCEGLAQVHKEISSGTWIPGDELEDIHMAVEARLFDLLGDVAGKLHTARSRNDQVATDLRLWLRSRLHHLDDALRGLVTTVLARVDTDGLAVIPGYTHLQRGQPILFGHHLLAYAWPLTRDLGRVGDALNRFDECPLGACAMAGTSFPIDRHRTASLLGFRVPTQNAMDSVAARDHVQEVAALCSILACHLSRMAEDVILWSSAEFSFVRLDDASATGSSIMPQKRNPDAAELVRGASATILGNCTALLALPRSQPLAYNRDLQHDREPLFALIKHTVECLRIMTQVWTTLTVDTKRFETELDTDLSRATDLADALVRNGMSFRAAHHLCARLARRCERLGCGFNGLEKDDLEDLHPGLAELVTDIGNARDVAEGLRSHGGSSPSEINRQVETLREMVQATP